MKTRYIYFLFLFVISMGLAQIILNTVSYNHYLYENRYSLSRSYANFTNYYQEYKKTYESKLNLIYTIYLVISLIEVIYGLLLVFFKIKEWKRNSIV
jgi:hypothetical protein